MTPQTKTIADKMTENRLKQVQGLVDDSDYAECALPHRQEVDRYLVDGIGLLVLRDAPRPPVEQRPFWQEWAIRAPYAAAVVLIVLVWLYTQVTGRFPMLPLADAGAADIVEAQP